MGYGPVQRKKGKTAANERHAYVHKTAIIRKGMTVLGPHSQNLCPLSRVARNDPFLRGHAQNRSELGRGLPTKQRG